MRTNTPSTTKNPIGMPTPIDFAAVLYVSPLDPVRTDAYSPVTLFALPPPYRESPIGLA